MTNVTKKPGGWSTVRQQLTTWDKPALLALVKELYEAAAENHDFIHARSKIGESGEALEKYRSKIVEQFFPARGDGKLKLGEARKAIRDYRKATGNIPGTAELLMTYVENGTQFTQEYGDIDERFYNAGDISRVSRPAGESGADGQRHRLGISRFRRRCRRAVGGGTRSSVKGTAINLPLSLRDHKNQHHARSMYRAVC